MKRSTYYAPQKKLALYNEVLTTVNDLGFPIIVEGKRDQIALKELGFQVQIIKLNDGQSILSTIEKLSNHLVNSREFIIFTDWDRTGRRLSKRLQKYGESVDLLPNVKFWNKLINLFSKDITCIEELPSIIHLLENMP